MNRFIKIAAVCAVVVVLGRTSASGQAGPPLAFNKIAPAYTATSQSLLPTLSWTASSLGATYEYCIDTTNDNACTDWISTGSRTYATQNLAPNTTYFWQVRATSTGTTYADGAAFVFWTFTTGAGEAPGSFASASPANGVTGTGATLVLSWGQSAGATSYEYCIDASNDNACSTWISTGTTSLVTVSSLSGGTTYYWYVRANNAFGTTYANNGVAWSFTTQNLPAAFTKASPVNDATNLPFTSVALSWNASPGSTGYDFCYGLTSDPCASWEYLGSSLTKTLSNLRAGTTYYWQVRATSIGGPTGADGGTFWKFTTQADSGPFAKVLPIDGRGGLPLDVDIAWEASAGAPAYEYCVDTTDDDSCGNWVSTTNISAQLTGLTPDTGYYWQVRAVNSLSATYADGAASAFHSFRTAPVFPPPVLPCNVLSLNGSTAYASSADTVVPVGGAMASFTVEAWVRPGTILPSAIFQTIVSDDGYALLLTQVSPNVLRLGYAPHPRNVGELYSPYLIDTRTLTPNEWHHVAFVYDDTAKQARFGVDGVLSAPINVVNLNLDFAPSGRGLMMGAFDGASTLNGLIDGVRISSIARYTSWTYLPTTGYMNDADTRALYQFGQTAGSTTFMDESGNGHTLTATGGAQTSGASCFDPAAPTVTSLTPNRGVTAGGTVLVITGTQFAAGATVTIGGTPATGVTINSSTSITATTAAHSDGKFDVVVRNPDGRTATVEGGFTYFADVPAAFGKVGPSSGTAGLTNVTLSWTPSAGALSYEYCIQATTNPCFLWTNVGAKTTAVALGFQSNTAYYWHVRAVNVIGVTYADAGSTDFWSFTTGTVPAVPDFRDFNGDGKPDLVWQNGAGDRYVWFMNGTSLMSGGLLAPNPSDAALIIAGVNDFTGDGKPDVLVQSAVDGTVTLFRMDGVTYVASQTIQATPNTPWRVVATGDFNGDQKPDIVWENAAGGSIYFWFMSSAGGVATGTGSGGAFAGDYLRGRSGQMLGFVNPNALIVGAADMDLDGSTDLIWQDQATGALSIWYLNGNVARAISPVSPAAVDPNWKIRAVGDYNGDGKPDLVFQHTNGSLYIWFMNGATMSGGTFLTPGAVNPVWKLVGPR